MKKILIIMLLFLCINVKASIVVMDGDSGRILYGKNEDERKLIASTTKIMTAIVALENSNIKTKLTVGEEVLKVNGSMIYSKPGEQYTIEDLLYGLMLRSGNDAAMTIAYNVFGYNRFIQEMNTKAMILGMTNTTYENPHGLNDDSYNYSTAKDLSKLMRYAIQNEQFLKITRTNKYNNWYNKNELLNEYKYLISGKTGYTKKSGQVYVSAATKNNKTLIISTIDENNKYELHKQLYEKYFDEYKKYKVLNQYTFSFKEKTNEKIHYYIRKDFDMLIKENEINDLKIKVDTQNEAVKIYIKDKLIHSQRLYKMEYKNKVNIIVIFRIIMYNLR